MKSQTRLLSRNSLKNFFKKDHIPTAENFEAMINSTVNKVDEGFNKTPQDGLILAPLGRAKKVLSFFKNIKDLDPQWHVTMDPDPYTQGLGISEKEDSGPRLFFRNGGNVGINTTSPEHPLEVNGMLGMNGRVGTLKVGAVRADRQWHQILCELDDVQAFEIMAEVRGIKGRGRYGLMHAMVFSTFGRSRAKIQCTQARFGSARNKLKLRWRGDVHNYSLEIRSRSHFGRDEDNNDIMIRYRICRLWGDDSKPLAPCKITPPKNPERLEVKPSLKV